MTVSQPDRLDRIEATLETVVQGLSKLDADIGSVSNRVDSLSERVDRTNDRVEIYQKASQQVVNLAFGLLATAAAAIIIPVILAR